MAAMAAAAQTVAAGALLGSQGFGLANSRFAGAQFGVKGVSNGSRLSCRTTYTIPKSRQGLLEEAEKRWEAALESPLAGVQFTNDEFADALSKYDFSFEIGDMVKGVVFKSDYNGALIDIGAKAPAYLPMGEACIHKLRSVEEVGLYPGTEEEFVVIKDDDDNGRMILSLRKIQYDLCWERCAQMLADDVVVRGTILSHNSGGFVVDVEGLRGFVPFSQVSARGAQSNPEELLNKEIPLKFLEVDEERTRLVLSNRKATFAENQSAFGIGSVVVGTVQTVKPYGAFIDIGGVSGLLHISQISHDRLTTVETVLSPGDKLKVMILSQDKDRGRISLSTKKLEPTPGDMLRNPQLVYEKADEMAKTFRQRVAQAEAAARAEELRLQQEAGFGVRNDFSTVDDSLGIDSLGSLGLPVE
ncbi:small ribosomal subunit protein bS1c [Physcomitrium patens]|uniref:S1 motif domain-containing protein n=1 Tax=Physcomitrium patens TaxID=3218 RepID=A0A2K1K004_PHYPA|nr:30S ribosomal protein S1, chloroplastic-like [Physcomitrium patens]PNR47112.1 hypothetical protein PHYPA_014232 [Physcomitrium patens]|eukprot:XP_024386702.1 30S ribosomal protein S1, chloroplastic-like [Physcomitrella patens]